MCKRAILVHMADEKKLSFLCSLFFPLSFLLSTLCSLLSTLLTPQFSFIYPLSFLIYPLSSLFSPLSSLLTLYSSPLPFLPSLLSLLLPRLISSLSSLLSFSSLHMSGLSWQQAQTTRYNAPTHARGRKVILRLVKKNNGHLMLTRDARAFTRLI